MPKDDNQRVIGQLEGKFDGLEKQVKSIKTEMVAKDARDQVRHNDLIERTDKIVDKVFDKVGKAIEESHSVPCCSLTKLHEDVCGEGGIRDQVKEIKTTGRVGWRAIVVTSGVAAFIIGSIITIALAIWPKG